MAINAFDLNVNVIALNFSDLMKFHTIYRVTLLIIKWKGKLTEYFLELDGLPPLTACPSLNDRIFVWLASILFGEPNIIESEVITFIKLLCN
jgi:hypothetical protein